MNSRPATKVKQHEYALLNEIAQDSLITQASLSSKLGIAVGSVNWYIKRLISRGWVKVSHLDRTRLKYDLTPAGMKIFTQRAVLYARDSLKVYSDFRNKARTVASQLKQENILEARIEGEDAIMDILRLTCIEAGIRTTDHPVDVTLRLVGNEYQIARRMEEQ